MSNKFAASGLLTGMSGSIPIIPATADKRIRLLRATIVVDPMTTWASGLCSYKLRDGYAGQDIAVGRAQGPTSPAPSHATAARAVIREQWDNIRLGVGAPLVLYISDAALTQGPIVQALEYELVDP